MSYRPLINEIESAPSFLVIILITPPMESFPYKEDIPLFEISTLSTISGGMCCNDGTPSVPGLSSTPLTRTFV